MGCCPATSCRGTYRAFRIRMGPLAVEGSTTEPPWVTWTSPASTSRRAALRAGSMRSRHVPPPTARAASDGQMVEVPVPQEMVGEVVAFIIKRATERAREVSRGDDSAPTTGD